MLFPGIVLMIFFFAGFVVAVDIEADLFHCSYCCIVNGADTVLLVSLLLLVDTKE